MAGQQEEARTHNFLPNRYLIAKRKQSIIQKLGFRSKIFENEAAEAKARHLIWAACQQDPSPLTLWERGILLEDVLDEIFGFGPLGPLLRDPADISDIYIEAHDSIKRIRNGDLIATPYKFDDVAHLEAVLNRLTWLPRASSPIEDDARVLVAPNGVRIMVPIHRET